MSTRQTKLMIALLSLGMAGVLSLLTIQLPMEDLPPELTDQFPKWAIQWLILINPSILLIIAVTIGIFLHEKVKLEVPLIRDLFLKQKPAGISGIIWSGIAGGIIAGMLIVGVASVFESFLPQEFVELGEKIKLSLAAKLLYGGITEEILLRFGCMTLVVWGIWKLSKQLTPTVYWLGIGISSLVFALGHFPVAFQAVDTPSVGLLSYILLGNMAGGGVFGYLYWKRGLEAAMIAHMVTHLVMIAGDSLING